MAPLAALRRVNVPLLLQFLANLLLGLSGTGFPIQVKNLVNRPQIVFGMPMTLQAPAHREGFLLVNHIHVVHLTVATHAADTPINVHRVIEISVIGYLVDFYPVDRIPALPTLPHGGQLWIVGLHLGVAVHARLGGRNIGV